MPPQTLEQRLKQRTVGLRRMIGLLGFERDLGMPLPICKRLRAFRLGFVSGTYRLYDLDRNDPTLYLPDMAHIDYALLEPYRLAVNDKLGFPHLMASVGARSPRLLGFVQGGHLQAFGQASSGSSLATLHRLLAQGSRIVLRPLGGLGGRGVFFVARSGDDLEVNRKVVTVAEAERWMAGLGWYVATEFVDQAEYARKLYPGSSNTLRLLTAWDYQEHEPFLVAACHRIGTSGTGQVDNFHSGLGGLSAPIDLERGSLGIAATLDPRGRLVRYSSHPESNAAIEGVCVPRWDNVVQHVLEVAAALPQFPYVGWDLIMTDSDIQWLEGNSPMGTDVWQVHEPLLKHARTRRFFSALGMI